MRTTSFPAASRVMTGSPGLPYQSSVLRSQRSVVSVPGADASTTQARVRRVGQSNSYTRAVAPSSPHSTG